MKFLWSNITPIFAIVATTTTFLSSQPAQAFNSLWEFNFSGEITGDGLIKIDKNQYDNVTQSYEVTEVNLTLDLGTEVDPQIITLANFPSYTQPLLFSPNSSSTELLHTSFFAQIGGLEPIQPEWILGMIPDIGGLTLSGSGEGVGTPDDPQGIGGTIIFTSAGTSPEIRSGTWTAQPIPEPLTILGAGMAIGFGTLFKKSLNL